MTGVAEDEVSSLENVKRQRASTRRDRNGTHLLGCLNRRFRLRRLISTIIISSTSSTSRSSGVGVVGGVVVAGFADLRIAVRYHNSGKRFRR